MMYIHEYSSISIPNLLVNARGLLGLARGQSLV